jgi:hypothetical protein
MNLADKKFKNVQTGEIVTVLDSFENIVILKNKQKVNMEELMNRSLFVEQTEIDPMSLIDSNPFYSSLAEKIKTIPTDNLIDDSITENFGGQVMPASNESAVIMGSEDDEREELMRKYNITQGPDIDAIEKQKQMFNRYLGEDNNNIQTTPARATSVNIIDPNTNYNTQSTNIPNPNDMNPMFLIFKNAKKIVDLSISVDIDEKIPRLDFIEMMEETYDLSIIDYLAEDFTYKLLKNPDRIKTAFKEKIEELVYGKKMTKPQKMDSKLNVNQRIEHISGLDSVDEINEFIKSERSKKVLDFANDKIKQLTND